MPRSGGSLLGLDAAGGRQVLLTAILIGVVAFALISALWLMRDRRRSEQERVDLEREHADAKARLARAEALLDVPDQRVMVWTAGDDRPSFRGRLAHVAGVPDERQAFATFSLWLTADTERALSDALHELRERAKNFEMVVETRAGAMIEATGRASGAQAILRFEALSEEQALHARMKDEHARTAARLDAITTLFERMDHPAWLRDADGRMTFANRAYVHAVEGTSAQGVLRHATPLLDRRDREAVTAHHDANRDDFALRASLWNKRLPVTVAGDRRMLDVTEACTAAGTVGFAIDMSEVEMVRASFEATVESHVRTLDHLTTAVASFDEHRRLRFHNQAFLKLWNLPPSVVEDGPDNASVFEELRARGRIAEQSDFRKWRDGVLRVYQAEDTYEDRWILPDGRTIRVVANPEPAGGVTWVFENVTEQQELETAFKELTRVQGETLDHLKEAVAVFGADGRLKLSNPIFAAVWGLPDDLVKRDAPLTAIVTAMQEATVTEPGDADVWEELVPAITGTGERETRSGRLIARSVYETAAEESEREQRILDYELVPLPDGQTMMTFVDVTATTRFEIALKERNEALRQGEVMKNRFLGQVSVKFRAPLQSVEGFAQMLHEGIAGELDERQKNYVNYIMASGAELARLVDNTLDLATMQAGMAELDLEESKVSDVLRGASEDMAGAFADRGLTLEMEVAKSAGHGLMDTGRIRHAVGNLLSNAAQHSPSGGRIRLTCTGNNKDIEIVVADDGPGISADMRDVIFQNFEAGVSGGAGLGLAIVRSVVELHGGRIELAPGVQGDEDGDEAALSGATFKVTLPRNAERHVDAP